MRGEEAGGGKVLAHGCMIGYAWFEMEKREWKGNGVMDRRSWNWRGKDGSVRGQVSYALAVLNFDAGSLTVRTRESGRAEDPPPHPRSCVRSSARVRHELGYQCDGCADRDEGGYGQ